MNTTNERIHMVTIVSTKFHSQGLIPNSSIFIKNLSKITVASNTQKRILQWYIQKTVCLPKVAVSHCKISMFKLLVEIQESNKHEQMYKSQQCLPVNRGVRDPTASASTDEPEHVQL